MKIKNWLIADDRDIHWKYRERFIGTDFFLLKLFYYIKLKRIEAKHNSETGISYHDSSAVFDGKPYFPHGLNGIVISRKARIGKNAIILHQVTIGTVMVASKVTEDLKAPVLGNNVYIGAGAKIIGNIRIGNNVIIGANAVVTKDVPDNSTVVGIPAHVLDKKSKYK